METPATLKLSIIIEDRSNPEGRNTSPLRNPHPGEILKEEFLNEIGMSQNQLAHAIGVPPNRIHAIVNGTRSITADTDLRLGKFFGLSEGYFLRLQNAFDTFEAKRQIMGQIAKIKPYKAARAQREEAGRLNHEGDHPRACLDQGAGRRPLYRRPAPASR